jgi:hypothetical protein
VRERERGREEQTKAEPYRIFPNGLIRKQVSDSTLSRRK